MSRAGGEDAAAGPVVLISGGSRGLGAALAADLLGRGWRVATFSRAGSEAVAELRRRDPAEEAFLWRAFDGTDEEAVRAFVLAVRRRWGRLDGLVNNAALGASGLLALGRAEEARRVIEVNLLAVLHLTRACARMMLERAAGAIVNVSSVNALRGHSGAVLYSVTKAGLDGLTRSLARELGPAGIRVNSVAPGYFASDMVAGLDPEQLARLVRRTPLGRMARVEEVVGVIRFLLSSDASFVSGQTLAVDGGLTC